VFGSVKFGPVACVSGVSYRTLSVLWLHIVYPHTVHGTHASQDTICSRNTDNFLYDLYLSTFNQVYNF